MKKALIIMSLAALLVMPLILVGCGDGGTTLTESDKATILGYAKRLDGHDTDIGNIRAVTNKLDEDTLATLMALAALDADELEALLDLDLDTALADIEKLKTDVSDINDPDKDGSLAKRVKALENGQSGSSSDGGTITSGEVTVTLDEEAPFLVLSSTAGTNPYRFIVTIANGTDDYQTVSYWVSFTCVSTDLVADIYVDSGNPLIPELSTSIVSFGGGQCGFDCTLIPAGPIDVRQLLFTPLTGFEVVVPRGKTVTLYHTVELKTDATELWEVTLLGISASEL